MKNNLIGQRFGRLTVIAEAPKNKTLKSRSARWFCQCDCGNIKIVSSSNLRSGSVKSCGCLYKETRSIPRKERRVDLTNQKFGKLTCLEPTENKGSDGSIIWKCQCDCGNYHYASVNSLRTGTIQSCGCQRSRGEAKIKKIFEENNVKFSSQYHFSDLKDKNFLYFDFAIFNEDKTLYCLIEYQGIQHYDPTVLHGAWKNAPQKHDNMKRLYCKQNNIKLIEIPYTDFDIIDWEYLKNKLSL